MLKRVRHLRKRLPSPAPTGIDTVLLGALLALLTIGLVMVGSASMDVSEDTFGDPLRIVIKQSVFMAAGLLVMGGGQCSFPLSVSSGGAGLGYW